MIKHILNQAEHIKYYVASGLLIATMGIFSTSHAASFDCEKATTVVENKICQTRSLNDADVKMATVYNIVLHALPMGGRDAEKSAQYQWLKQRNACGANTKCLTERYAQRQAQLDAIIQNRVLSQGPF